MTARVSVWRPFQRKLPTHSTNQPMEAIRHNLLALSVSNATAAAHGWSYTNSVTRGEAAPGTAVDPARKYWSCGSGNETIWVKAECTYGGGGLLEKVAFYYSDDNEASYVPLVDDSPARNYILNIFADGSGNVTYTTWSNT